LKTIEKPIILQDDDKLSKYTSDCDYSCASQFVFTSQLRVHRVTGTVDC